jgi:hypothetical protein
LPSGAPSTGEKPATTMRAQRLFGVDGRGQSSKPLARATSSVLM